MEKNQACTKLTTNQYPDKCHFKNILDLVQNPPSEDCWNPSKLVLVKEAYCQTHKKMSFDAGLVYFFWFHCDVFQRVRQKIWNYNTIIILCFKNSKGVPN